MKTMLAIRPLVDAHMAVVCVAAVVGTFLCRRVDLLVDLPADLLGIAVIFPVVFSISSAYARREEALKSFAVLKANAASLYFAYRDWPEAQNALGDRGPTTIHRLLNRVGVYFEASEAGKPAALREVYRSFDEVSVSYRYMLDAGVSRSELSRLGAYLMAMMTEFETMRNFAVYRTPITLRAFSHFFLSLFPILLTPYFAYIAFPEQGWIGYVVAFMYGVVLVGLDNVQDELENPYAGIGPDDLQLAVADDYVSMLTAVNGSSPSPAPSVASR